MNVATVRQIFKSAEDIVFDYLSSTTPSETTKIKLFNGLNVESKYSYNNPKGMLRGAILRPKISTKARFTKYYNQKINDLIE